MMDIKKIMNFLQAKNLFATLAVAVALIPTNVSASATALSASTGGTFTFNYNSAALGLAAGGTVNNNGYYLTNFYNTAASDPSNPANTASYFTSNAGTTPISEINLVQDISPTGANPSNQPTGRHVQGTSPTFAIDSTNLAGVSGTELGLTGIQSFYAPAFGTRGHVTAGDFSLAYNPSETASGWYIQNNFSFPLIVYDLSNLALIVTDANNWKLSGDLLLASGYAGMIYGQTGADVGTFNLSVGSYAVSAVPVPGAVWLFGSALAGVIGFNRRKSV
jgi:hypothetical protein